jgi:hypothetical protein
MAPHQQYTRHKAKNGSGSRSAVRRARNIAAHFSAQVLRQPLREHACHEYIGGTFKNSGHVQHGSVPAQQSRKVQWMNFGHLAGAGQSARLGNPAVVGGTPRIAQVEVVLQLRMGTHQQEQINAA